MLKTWQYLTIRSYTPHRLMAILFFSNKTSVMEVIQMFQHFSIFPRLKPYKPKWGIDGIGVLKGVQMAFCGIEYVNLMCKL